MDLLRLMRLDSRGYKALGFSLYVDGLCAAFGMAFPQISEKPISVIAGVMAQLLAALIVGCMGRLRGWVLAQFSALVLTLIAATLVLPEPYADNMIFGAITGVMGLFVVFGLFVAAAAAMAIYMGIKTAFEWLDERFGPVH